MSTQQDKAELQADGVSPRRRQLVKGAAAAVPAILTLRSDPAGAMNSAGLVSDSDEHRAVALDDNGNTYYLCVDTAASGYPGKFHSVEGSECWAESRDACGGATNGTYRNTGVLVSSTSMQSANVIAPNADKICNG